MRLRLMLDCKVLMTFSNTHWRPGTVRVAPRAPAQKEGFRMKTCSDRHPRTPAAMTPEEFDACTASGEVFEPSEEPRRRHGILPRSTEDVISDEEFLSYPGTCPAGFGQDDPNLTREIWKQANAVTDIPDKSVSFSQERSTLEALPGPAVLIVPGRSGGRF